MKETNFLNWSDSYLKACEKFGIDPQTGLEPFSLCLSPIFYFAPTTDSSIDLAMKIFEIFESTTPKVVLDKSTKQTHLEHINKLQEFILGKSDHAEEEYLKSIDVWYDAVKPMLSPRQLNTSNGLIIEIRKDCCLLCNFMGCSPVKLLQYYIDHVDCGAVDNENTLATEFFIRKFSIANSPQ